MSRSPLSWGDDRHPNGYARRKKAQQELLEGAEMLAGADENIISRIQGRLAALGSAGAAASGG
jgi:hypothetical protein